MNKTLLAILTMALLPTAFAHAPAGTPNSACNANENPHDYLGGSDVSVGGQGFGTTVVTDGCPTGLDGDYEFGYGGGFLPASHHGSNVCVTDNVLGAYVSFTVGADADGDGVLSPALGDGLATGTGCVNAGFGPGADGGWWVIIHNPATSGHITA